jgi:glycosyltransferase involved in cell wall biosynthesis
MIQDNSRFEIHEGYAPGDLVPELFQRASLVALPYLSAASSGVLMTAYAFGRPVVATNISGLLEYVQDGVTGLLVAPADVEQLAGAIVRLLSDDILRQRMGENAAHWVNEELSAESVAMQTLKVYEKAICAYCGETR